MSAPNRLRRQPANGLAAPAPQRRLSPAFPRWEPLIEYFEGTFYPHLFGGQAPVYANEALALTLLGEFEDRLGSQTCTHWVLSYLAELVRLFELTGQPVAAALAVIQDGEVSAQLHELFVRQQATAGQVQ